MRNSRQDSLYSQQYIMEALSQLTREKDLDGITVTDLCKKAGVARVTFYKYYQTIYDVLEASIEKDMKQFLEEINHLNGGDSFQHLIEGIINVISVEHNSLKKLIESNRTGMLLHYLTYAMEEIYRTNTPLGNYLNRTQVLFVAGGMTNVVIDWVKNGVKESPNSVAKRIYEVLQYKESNEE